VGKKILEWIGSGSGLNPVLGNTSFLIGNDSKRNFLVDCGSTVPLELIKSKEIGDVTDIVITHLHADHIGGLEGLGFMNYFALNRRGDNRPNLYLASKRMAYDLWNHALKAGMIHSEGEGGEYMKADLESYFNVHIGKRFSIPGLIDAELFETPHVPHLECYGIYIDSDIFYSGDTTQMPETDAQFIFQDCQFFDGGAHISYDRLNRKMSSEMKARTHLVHLGMGYESKNPVADGFAGFVKPGDKFVLDKD